MFAKLGNRRPSTANATQKVCNGKLQQKWTFRCLNGKIQYQKASVDIVHAGSLGSQFTYGNNHVFIPKIEMTTPIHIFVLETTYALIGHTLKYHNACKPKFAGMLGMAYFFTPCKLGRAKIFWAARHDDF